MEKLSDFNKRNFLNSQDVLGASLSMLWQAVSDKLYTITWFWQEHPA